MPSVSSQPVGRALLEGGRDAGWDVVPGRREEEPRLGAELARSEGEGADEPGGDLLGPGRGAGGHHDRVHGAHLGVHGDDRVALDGQSPQRQSTVLGTGERDSGDLGGAHQALPRLEACDHPERTLGRAGGRKRGARHRGEERAGLADGPGAPSRPPGTRRRAPSQCRCPGLRRRRGSCWRRARRPGRAAPASGAGPGRSRWRGRWSPGGTTTPRRPRRRSGADRHIGRARWSAGPGRARSRGRRPAPARWRLSRSSRASASAHSQRRRSAGVAAATAGAPADARATTSRTWTAVLVGIRATTVPVRASWLTSLIGPRSRRRRPRSRRVRRGAGRR